MFVDDDRRSISDRRADASREAIVDAAWRLSRRQGLTGWSLRALATEVGLAAPTLYAYVDSKHGIYSEMFRQGYEALEAQAAGWEIDPTAVRASFASMMRGFFAFCTSDPTRYQLMFQRVVPDFEPSPEAYAASVSSYERFRSLFAEIGVTDDADLDLWTAISTGLTDQQISNDPGGDRWQRLLSTAVGLFCDHLGIPPDTDPDDGGTP